MVGWGGGRHISFSQRAARQSVLAGNGRVEGGVGGSSAAQTSSLNLSSKKNPNTQMWDSHWKDPFPPALFPDRLRGGCGRIELSGGGVNVSCPPVTLRHTDSETQTCRSADQHFSTREPEPHDAVFVGRVSSAGPQFNRCK